jgi:CheY-like chemotaxis protein
MIRLENTHGAAQQNPAFRVSGSVQSGYVAVQQFNPLPARGGRVKVDFRPGGLRVLIIDRQEETAASLAFLLSRHDTVVRIALDPGIALAEAERFEPALCIVETGLLARDGAAFARAIRNCAAAPPLLVALSGFAQPADALHARRAGVDHHFDAPPTADELDRLLDRARGLPA